MDNRDVLDALPLPDIKPRLLRPITSPVVTVYGMLNAFFEFCYSAGFSMSYVLKFRSFKSCGLPSSLFGLTFFFFYFQIAQFM